MTKHIQRALSLLLAALLTLTLLPDRARAAGWTVITLDPGHGGRSSGAVSAVDGVEYIERDLTMQIALYLKEELEQYARVKVYLTREDNTGDPDLEERVRLAADRGSDALVSLHLNALDGRTRGSTVAVTEGRWDPHDLRSVAEGLGNAILEELSAGLGLENDGLLTRRSHDYTYPNHLAADYYGIVRHGVNYGVAALIVEHCYMDNAADVRLALNSEAKLRALARADALGIARYFGLVTREEDRADYEGHRLEAYVDHARERGWMLGYDDGLFHPDDDVSRAMLTTLLMRFDGAPARGGGVTFSDVGETAWYRDGVAWAARRGIVLGLPDGTFRPEDGVTNEQVAAMALRYLADRGVTLEPVTEDDLYVLLPDTRVTETEAPAADEPPARVYAPFLPPDFGDTSDWAREDVAALFREGLLADYAEGAFLPAENATRAQICLVLTRLEAFLTARGLPVPQPETGPEPEPEPEPEPAVFLTLDDLAVGETVDPERLSEELAAYFAAYEIEKGGAVYERISGRSYVENPNVALSDLRYLKLLHYNFDHRPQVGELIVNKAVAEDVLAIFRELYEWEYEIESMRLIDDYWAGDGDSSDWASIDHNNTSAFCYRAATGSGRLSYHAYGLAIDLNPQQNPYVSYSSGKAKWSHENADAYIDRTSGDPHVIVKGDACYELFKKYGFTWGGDWSNPKDYQHFEKRIF